VRLVAVLVAGITLSAACTGPLGAGRDSRQPASVTVVMAPAKAAPPAVPNYVLDPDAPIPLDRLPGYAAPTAGEGEWTWSRPLLDADGALTWRVIGQNDAATPVVWGGGEDYSAVPGVLTFRGNNYRSAPAYGSADVQDKKLSIEWTHPITAVDSFESRWYGAGWTGQPLLVQWGAEARAAMGLNEPFASDPAFTEVLYPVFGGVIHRLDLATGAVTKPAIEGSCPFKGTAAVDPRGYPLLYAGQGLPDRDGTICPWRYRIFDLIENREVAGWAGDDPDAPRAGWGAFDAAALIDAESDYLIEGGENGLIYKARLNASFDAASGSVSVAPEVTKVRFAAPSSARYGIEGSIAAYRNIFFTQDNDGVLAAWDAITLTNIWARLVGDDADATVLVEEKTDQLGAYLYVGNEVDHRGDAGVTNLRKIDALTGELLWQVDVEGVFDANTNGGLVASPLLGAGQAASLVIFNVARTHGAAGALLGVDKATGGVVWRRDLANYSWSSPIGIMGEDGNQYGVFCDSAGLMHLFDPANGEDWDVIFLGGNVESSPAAFGNMIVVGNYSLNIYGIKIS
jgi:hypothetical protein